MYKTDFICNYKQHEDEDKEDMYRIQLLQIFDLELWDDTVINTEIQNIFNKYKDDLKDILEAANKSEKLSIIKNVIGNDDLTLFKGLFQFELCDLIHLCICDLTNSNTIKIINKNNLINNL
tara:strand:+ start:5047 stop:5409 length:363 start_codon:yes stop_codon:yes gene_type:complete